MFYSLALLPLLFTYQLCLNFFFLHFSVFQIISVLASFQSPSLLLSKLVCETKLESHCIKRQPLPSFIPQKQPPSPMNSNELRNSNFYVTQNKFSDLFKTRFICLWICNVKYFKNMSLLLEKHIS